MVRLELTENQKKEIVQKMEKETLNKFVSFQINDEKNGQMFVGAMRTEQGIDVYGKRHDSEKSYTIPTDEITTLSSKGGRRRRARKTNRRKSNKKRHTRRYRQK